MYLDSWNDIQTGTYRKFRPDILHITHLINLGSSVVEGRSCGDRKLLMAQTDIYKKWSGLWGPMVCDGEEPVISRDAWTRYQYNSGLHRKMTKNKTILGVRGSQTLDHCLEFHSRLKEVICTVQSSDKTMKRCWNTQIVFYSVSDPVLNYPPW